MRVDVLIASFSFANLASAQLIWDVWQTTWDQKNLFKSLRPRPPLQFTKPGAIGAGNIIISDTVTYQNMVGFGGSLTDSSALLFNNLKTKNPTNYWKLMNYLFNATEGANAAGLSYLRIPMGASDFAAKAYSYADVENDYCLREFSIDNAPSYVYTVLADILSVNPAIQVHIVPWSPPAWMKTTGNMRGGTLKNSLLYNYAQYLFKAVEAFISKGVNVYAISIQNEPLYSDSTYPTSTLSVDIEAKIGVILKAFLRASDVASSVKLIGYEHNWGNNYPTKLMQAAGDVFDGVAFHCYGGSVGQQAEFQKVYPNKEIYFTECSGVFGTNWWNDIKWNMDSIFIGAVENYAKTALMWNLALDGKGEPRIPGTRSCGGSGCRGIVTINSNGTWSANQEFYAMAQVSKATIPRDIGGPSGRRIKSTVGGTLSWALKVSAFETGRKKASDAHRYSLVVLNWNDNVGGWNPTPVKTTILFRGMQATYTFPVGVTTLWWYTGPFNASDTEHVDELVAESSSVSTQLQFVVQGEAL